MLTARLSSSALAETTKLMKPRPIGETSGPSVPSLRWCVTVPVTGCSSCVLCWDWYALWPAACRLLLSADGSLLVLAARPGQTEAVAQRGAGVFRAEQAAAAQLGRDVLDEQLQAAREDVEVQVEAVGGPRGEPVLHVVGDLLRRADALPVRPPVAQQHLAHGPAVFAGELDGRLEEPPGALDGAGVGELAVGDLLVKREIRRVQPEAPGQALQLAVQVDQRVKLVLAGPCLGLGGTDDRVQARQDDQVVGIAAVAGCPGPHVVVELARSRMGGLRGEDDVGGPGAEPLAGFRGAGLDQDRPALRRARHDERAAHAEVP